MKRDGNGDVTLRFNIFNFLLTNNKQNSILSYTNFLFLTLEPIFSDIERYFTQDCIRRSFQLISSLISITITSNSQDYFITYSTFSEIAVERILNFFSSTFPREKISLHLTGRV